MSGFSVPSDVLRAGSALFGYGVPSGIQGMRDVSFGPTELTTVGDNDIYLCPTGKRAILLTSNLRNPTLGTITYKTQFKRSGTYYEVPVSGTALSSTIASNALVINQFIFTILEAGEYFSFNVSATGMHTWTRVLEVPDTAPIKTARLFSIPNTDTALYTCPANHIAYPMGITLGSMITMAPSLTCVNKAGGARVLGIYGPVADSLVSDATNIIASASIADQTIGSSSPGQAVPPILRAGQSIVVKADSAGAGYILMPVWELPTS